MTEQEFRTEYQGEWPKEHPEDFESDGCTFGRLRELAQTDPIVAHGLRLERQGTVNKKQMLLILAISLAESRKELLDALTQARMQESFIRLPPELVNTPVNLNPRQ